MKKITKFLAVILSCICVLSMLSVGVSAAEKDCICELKLTSSVASPKPGESFTVTVSAKTNYPVINVNSIIVYDSKYYELDTSNGVAVKKATKMPVGMNQATNSPLGMYHQSYSAAMAKQYKLVFVGITWLPSLSSQGKNTPTTTLNDFTNLYTVKFKMKSKAPTDGKGFLGIDPAYVKDENASMRSGVYASHGGATLGDKVVASYGQTIDLSQAVLFGTEVVKTEPDYNVTINYKSSADVAKLLNVSGFDWFSADTSIVDSYKSTITAGKTGTTYIAGVSADGKTMVNCEVTVNYAWWQWIIIIVLFGWLWY